MFRGLQIVFLYPCEFVRELTIILFPLDKFFELIPWNDCNFSMVIVTMSGCDMRKLIDIMLLKWFKRRRLHYFLSSSN